MRLPEVKQKTGLPKSSIYRKISENSFPKQISIGAKQSFGWKAILTNG
jgi:prophage regulatory protein